MDLSLRGRTALVCASTSGLGRATAEALAAEGVRVVISGRRDDVARELAASLPGAESVALDYTAADAAVTLAARARRALDAEMDIVILNGPGPRPGRASDTDPDQLASALQTLMLFQQQLVAALLPGMCDRGWGRILAIGSSAVAEPLPNMVSSNVGRAALGAYLKTLAGEVARHGVTVNMLHPGRIDTERVRQLDSARAEAEGRTAQEVAEQVMASIPAGRYGQPAEFAAMAAFLCGEQAGYITGSAIRVDGGLVRHL